MGRLEVEFEGFLQVDESLFFGLALTGNIEFEALGDVPGSLAPNGCGKWPFHGVIVSQDDGHRHPNRRHPGLEGAQALLPSGLAEAVPLFRRIG